MICRAAGKVSERSHKASKTDSISVPGTTLYGEHMNQKRKFEETLSAFDVATKHFKSNPEWVDVGHGMSLAPGEPIASPSCGRSYNNPDNRNLLVDQSILLRLNDCSRRAVNKWGEDSQLDMMQEEAAELLCELVRRPRGRQDWDKIVEEIVDTYIMCHEMIYMFGIDRFQEQLIKKLNRFEPRLDN